MTPAEIKSAAVALFEAEKSGVQMGLLSVAYPKITMDDAYAIQAELIVQKQAEGLDTIGWKIGLQ